MNTLNIDLDELSLVDLKALRAKVAKAIDSFEERLKREAVAELEARARDLGFTLNELAGSRPTKSARSPAAPKFANPGNPAMTWSGRGRQPRWFSEALAAGKTEDDLAI